jgi:iron complex transport system substrate-binding protein
VPAQFTVRRIAFTLALALAACAGSAHDSASNLPVRRVVTLMPSFAEDLCAMGKASLIAGVSEYGNSAACAPHAPAVANFSSVDVEKVISLHPDLVVAIPAQRRLAAPLERAGIRMVYLSDDSFGDLFRNIRMLGELTGSERAANRLNDRLRSRTNELRASGHFTKRPAVFVVLQAQPVWTVGPQSYISTLLNLAGARNAVTRLPRPYAQYSAEALLKLQPDAIVAGSDTQLQTLLDREPWRSLRAVQRKHVYILQDPDVLERPGPSYNEGLSWLIEHLRPLNT